MHDSGLYNCLLLTIDMYVGCLHGKKSNKAREFSWQCTCMPTIQSMQNVIHFPSILQPLTDGSSLLLCQRDFLDFHFVVVLTIWQALCQHPPDIMPCGNHWCPATWPLLLLAPCRGRGRGRLLSGDDVVGLIPPGLRLEVHALGDKPACKI